MTQDVVALLPKLRSYALALTRNHPAFADYLVERALKLAIQRVHADEDPASSALEDWLFDLVTEVAGRPGAEKKKGGGSRKIVQKASQTPIL